MIKKIISLCLTAVLLAPFSFFFISADPEPAVKTIKYYVSNTWAPNRVLTQNGRFGFEIDIISLIFEDDTYNLEIIEDPKAYIISGTGKLELNGGDGIYGLHSLKLTKNDDLMVSKPLCEFYWGAFTRAEMYGKLDFSDMYNLKIGYTGTDKAGRDFAAHDYKCVEYASPEDALNALLNKEIDIWFEEKRVGNYAITQKNAVNSVTYHEELEIVDANGIYIGGRDEELLSFVNSRINQIKNNGTYEVFYKKYFSTNSQDYYDSQNRRLIFLVIIGAIILLFSIAVIWFLAITTRKNARLNAQLAFTVEELHESRERYLLALDGTNDGIFYYLENKGYLFFSRRFRQIIGIQWFTDQNDITMTVREILSRLHPADASFMRDTIKKFLQSAYNSDDKELRIINSRNEVEKWILFKAKSVLEDGKIKVGGSISDITSRKTSENESMYFADHDFLTGLYNRRKIYELGERMLSDAKYSGGVLHAIYADLDNFKAVNDTYSHQAGDDVLKAVVKNLNFALPVSSVLSRVGGDEFVALIPDPKNELDTDELAQRIISSINNIRYGDIRIGISLGYSNCPAHSSEIDELIKLADLAAMEAKRTGKNHMCRSVI